MSNYVIISRNIDIFHFKSFKNGILELSILMVFLKIPNIIKKLKENPVSFKRDFTVFKRFLVLAASGSPRLIVLLAAHVYLMAWFPPALLLWYRDDVAPIMTLPFSIHCQEVTCGLSFAS